MVVFPEATIMSSSLPLSPQKKPVTEDASPYGLPCLPVDPTIEPSGRVATS